MKKEITNYIKADNFDDLFARSIYEIEKNGIWVNPRGMLCKEIIAPQLVLTDIDKCLINIKERKLNYAYLIIEKMSYLSGLSNENILIEYNKQMKNYINPKTNMFDGSYGPRLRKQLDWIYEELKNDNDSRRAVITINNENDRHETLDNPCTLSLNFLLRDNRLNLITTMRSNDIKWGTCLDIPAFCFIQEVLSYWLGVEKGIYIHQPASLHYYKQFENELLSYLFYDKEECEIFSKGTKNNRNNPKWNITFGLTNYALDEFWYYENIIRNKGNFKKSDSYYPVISEYLQQIKNYWDRKNT